MELLSDYSHVDRIHGSGQLHIRAQKDQLSTTIEHRCYTRGSATRGVVTPSLLKRRPGKESSRIQTPWLCVLLIAFHVMRDLPGRVETVLKRKEAGVRQCSQWWTRTDKSRQLTRNSVIRWKCPQERNVQLLCRLFWTVYFLPRACWFRWWEPAALRCLRLWSPVAIVGTSLNRSRPVGSACWLVVWQPLNLCKD